VSELHELFGDDACSQGMAQAVARGAVQNSHVEGVIRSATTDLPRGGQALGEH
jgi:hypothetical protein